MKKENGNKGLLTAESLGFSQKRSVPGTVFGIFCRFVIAFAGATGLCLMLDNAFTFGRGSYDPAGVVLCCFIFCLAWFLLFLSYNVNGVFFGITAGVEAVAALLVIISFGAKDLLIYSPAAGWNHIVSRLDALGYSSLNGLRLLMPQCDPLTPHGMILSNNAFILFCAAVSLVFVFCTYKKVRTVPVIITSGIVMTVTFTYNLLTDNMGFLLIICSGISLIVLKYHAVFMKREDAGRTRTGGTFASRRAEISRLSYAGTAAFVAGALVFSVGIYPAVKINGPAPEIDIFEKIMKEARARMAEYLTGEENQGDTPAAPFKSISPTPRSFSNENILTVTAPTDVNLYLKSWVGDEYKNNQWIASSADTDGINVMPEEVTELFYQIVDRNANIILNPRRPDMSYADRGFIKEFVTVSNRSIKGWEAFLPSRFSAIYKVTEPGDITKDYAQYTLIPGTGLLRLPMRGASYGAVAYAPNYKNVNLYRLDSDMTVYGIVYPRLKQYMYSRLSGDGNAHTEYAVLMQQIHEQAEALQVVIPDGCIMNRAEELSDEELTELADKMYDVAKYESYVYEHNTAVPWSDESVLSDAAEKAFGGRAYAEGTYPDVQDQYIPDSFLKEASRTYYCADKTARYLADICTYDLAPEGYTSYGSYISQFLTTARSGYCVQYATAGALILRAAGIPTRYADGYICQDPEPEIGSYTFNVLDKNAHAWIEVYLRGYGWMTYEMTEPMLDGMYSSRTPGYEPDPYQPGTETEIVPPVTETDAPVTRPEITGPETTDAQTPAETSDVPGRFSGPAAGKIFAVTAAVAVSVLAVSTVIYVYLKKTAGRKKNTVKRLKKAAGGASDDPDGDIAFSAEQIFFMLSLIGLGRSETELMSDYISRIEEAMFPDKSFEDAGHAIEKSVFGRCADPADAAKVAEYALYLKEKVPFRLTRRQYFYYVKLRKLI